MSSVSIQGQVSSIQSSQIQKSIAGQGINEGISFRNINEKFLFPFYDEMLRMVKLHPFFPGFLVIVILDQVFASISIYINNDITNLFTNFNVNSAFEMITIPFFYLVGNLVFFIYLFYSYRLKRIFNFWQLYTASLLLNFFNLMIFPPVCGTCGYSILQINTIINSHNYRVLSNLNNNAAHQSNMTTFSSYGFINKFLFKSSNLSLANQKPTKKNMNHNKYYPKIYKKYYDYKDKYKETINYQKRNDFTQNFTNFYPKSDKIYGAEDNHTNPDHKSEPKPPEEDDNRDIEINYFILFLEANFSKHLFALIFTLIEAIILFCQILYNFRFMSESPYLNRSIFAMWDSQVFTLFILLNGMTQFFSYFLKILPVWCTSFYQICILIFIVYIMYYTFFQPFIKTGMNVFIQSLLSTTFMSTFFSFIYQLTSSIILFFLINFSIFFFFIFLIAYYFINRKIISTVDKKLSPPTVKKGQSPDQTDSFESSETPRKKKNKLFKRNKWRNSEDDLLLEDEKQETSTTTTEMTEQEKRELFDSYVFQSIEHALLYFRVGISKASPFLIDFSFMRYMKECYGQKPIQFFILQLSALFPSQHQFFAFCMTSFGKKVDFFNTDEHFLMYQLHRINIIRQSSVSKEVQNELVRLEKMSDDTISTIRGFWAELLQSKTEFNTASLGFIRKMTMNTKSNYVDAIEKFPNSQQILNSYCRFLCEACGDFVECARVGQKVRLIEQGKNLNADHCFHSFVNVFPHYLKRRILDTKGSFISNQSFISSTSSSMSSDRLSASFDNARGMPMNPMKTSSNTKNFTYKKYISNKKQYKEEFENLIEQEHFETLINTLFTKGKQRLAVQQIVDGSGNNALNIARSLSIIQWCISLIVMSLSFVFISFPANTMNLVESSTRISKISSSFEYCALLAGVQYLTEKHNINFSQIIKDKLNIRDENLPIFPCTFIYPIASLNQMKNSIIQLVDEEMKFIMSNPENHFQEISTYTGIEHGEEEYLMKIFYLNESLPSSLDISSFFHHDERWEEGIVISKFSDEIASFFRMTLRNGIEYFISSVERLAFDKTLYMADQFFENHPRPGQPGTHQYQEALNSIFNDNSNLHLLNFDDDKNMSQFYNYYFGILWNGLMLSEPFSFLFKVISDNAIQITNSYSKVFRVTIEAILILFSIIFLFARTYDYILIKQSIKVTSIVMQKLKSEDIIETMKPIYLKSKKKIKINSTGNHSIYDYSSIMILYPIVVFFSIAGFLVFFAVSLLQFINTFPFIENAFQWSSNGANRFLSLAKLLNGLIAEKIGIFNFSVSEQLLSIGVELLDVTHQLDLSIIGRNNDLDSFYFMIHEYGTSDLSANETNETKHTTSSNKSKIPFKSKKKVKASQQAPPDIRVDYRRLITPQCDTINNSDSSTQLNFATYLDCISIENKINLAIHFYNLLRTTLFDDKKEDLVENPEFIASLFILDKYLFTDLPEFQEQIEDITKEKLNSQTTNVYIIGIIGIVFCFIFMLLEQLLITHFNFSYEAFKQLIMVLPPSAFVNNPCLINFLINMFTNAHSFLKTSNSIMSTISKLSHFNQSMLSDEEILVNSVDQAVINICKDFIIQSVNPSIQKMTGFQSDQLLGQGLIYLIPLTSQKEKTSLEVAPFYQRLEEIKSNSGDRVAEVNATILTDKGEEILVQATIIGIFDKKTGKEKVQNNRKPSNKLNHKIKSKSNYIVMDDSEGSDSSLSTTNNTGSNTASNTTTATSNTTYNNFNLNNRNSNNLNFNDDEEFVGATIILKDISAILSQRKELKEMKKKTEALVNMLLPPPVLETIRVSKKKLFYKSKTATLIKIELCGLDDYIGSVMPKNIMTYLQNLYSKIANINQTEEPVLFVKNERVTDDSNIMNFDSNNNSFDFHFNFDANINSVDDGDFFMKSKLEEKKQQLKIEAEQAMFDASDENLDDDDEICDFKCIYNIRNYYDNFISIAGLFNTQEDLQKQAESCVRYALNIKRIFESAELEEQFNLFVHARIVVCMGGPVDGIIEDPEKPNVELITDLMQEADRIRDSSDVNVVYINEMVYENMVKENYFVEEKTIFANNSAENKNEDDGEFVCNLIKVYRVERCLRKKANVDNNGGGDDDDDDGARSIQNNVNAESTNNVFVIQDE